MCVCVYNTLAIASSHQDAPCSQFRPPKFPHQSTSTGVCSSLRAETQLTGCETWHGRSVVYLCLLQHGCVVHVELPRDRLDQSLPSHWDHCKPSSKDTEFLDGPSHVIPGRERGKEGGRREGGRVGGGRERGREGGRGREREREREGGRREGGREGGRERERKGGRDGGGN